MRQSQAQALEEKAKGLPNIRDRNIFEMRGSGFDAEITLVTTHGFSERFHDAVHDSDLRVKHSGTYWEGDDGFPKLVLKFDL
jgi:hypothetical protein